MIEMFNQIWCYTAPLPRRPLNRHFATGYLSVLTTMASLVFFLDFANGQFYERVGFLNHKQRRPPPWHTAARHQHRDRLESMDNLFQHRLGSNRFNLQERRPSESWSDLSADAWAERPWNEQYRSINAHRVNPAKSPLSTRAFFSSSTQKQPYTFLSADKPTSLSMATFTTTEVSVPTVGEQVIVDPMEGNIRKGEDTGAPVWQIDRRHHELLPRPAFPSLIDKGETIENGHQRMGLKRGAYEKKQRKKAVTSIEKARRISKRKLEQYDNSDSHFPVANSKQASGQFATISTRADKQPNETKTEPATTSGSPLDRTLYTADDFEKSRQRKSHNVTEHSSKDNKPVMGIAKSDNLYTGNLRDGVLVDGSSTDAGMPANDTLQETKYVAEQTAKETSAARISTLPATLSPKRSVTGLPKKPYETAAAGSASGTDQDEDDKAADTTESEAEETTENRPEGDFRIKKHSSLVPSYKSKEDKQNVNSLVLKGYSNRDRGFGFIKAWAWDRAEDYRVKKSHRGEREAQSKSKTIGKHK